MSKTTAANGSGPRKPEWSTPGSNERDQAYGGTRAGQGGGDERMRKWTNPLETIDLCDQHALREFCETGRLFFRYLAVLLSVSSTELEEAFREMAKRDRNPALMGFDVWRKVRRATKHIQGAGDAAENAAGQLVAAWIAFEREFGPLLEQMGHRTGDGLSSKGFTIR